MDGFQFPRYFSESTKAEIQGRRIVLQKGWGRHCFSEKREFLMDAPYVGRLLNSCFEVTLMNQQGVHSEVAACLQTPQYLISRESVADERYRLWSPVFLDLAKKRLWCPVLKERVDYKLSQSGFLILININYRKWS